MSWQPLAFVNLVFSPSLVATAPYDADMILEGYRVRLKHQERCSFDYLSLGSSSEAKARWVGFTLTIESSQSKDLVPVRTLKSTILLDNTLLSTSMVSFILSCDWLTDS